MLKLLKYMRGYRISAISAPLFKVLESIFELLIPLVVKNIIDIGIAGADKPYITKMCLLMVILGAVGFLCTMVAQYFAAKASVGFCGNLRSALFAHTQKLSFTDLDRLGTSTVITRMTSDINQVQSGVNLTLRLFSRSPIVVFGALIMTFTIDTKVALVFAVAIPVLCLVVFGIMLAGIPLYRKVQRRLDRVLGITRENLSGARVIRAFTDENREIKTFRTESKALVTVQKFSGKISSLMNPLTYLLVNIAILALLYTGALRVDAGLLTQGAVIALYNYMSQILIELIKLANVIIQMTKAAACGDRIEALLSDGGKEPILLTDAVKQNDDAVTFRHVGLTYEGASDETLSDISFSIRRGSTVGIIGGTGSGKTSLVSLFTRFYDATQGEVLLNGLDVRAYRADELREKVGIVMQQTVLFHGTVRENLRWGKPDATDAELWKALEAAQAKDVVESKEGGLDYVIEQGGRNLSGGQRQRLGIARTLVGNPDILILDDSASALDYATDARLRAAIRSLGGAHTVFIISQRAASLFSADLILVLDDGHLVASGTHRELLDNCPVYREIYHSQFPEEVSAS